MKSFESRVLIDDHEYEGRTFLKFGLDKKVEEFILEYEQIKMELWQSSTFQLRIHRESSSILAQSKSLFYESFQIVYLWPDLETILTDLPLVPAYESVSVGTFYHSSSIPNNKKQNTKQDSSSFDSNAFVNEAFAKQEQAFQLYDTLNSEQRAMSKIFTFESSQTGKRRFAVMNCRAFHSTYQTIPIGQKHVYEIIRDSFPCRIYFDLEYNPLLQQQQGEENKGRIIDGNVLTRKFIYLVLWKLYQLFQLSLDWKNVLVLDSSTEQKFSKHVIIHMTTEQVEEHLLNHQERDKDEPQSRKIEYLFPSNLVIGDLLQLILYDLTEEVEVNKDELAAVSDNHEESDELQQKPDAINSPSSIANKDLMDSIGENTKETRRPITQRKPKPEYEEFWLLNEDHQRQFFVDLGVYSRNRAFRLFGSCKYGKKKAFTLHPNDKKSYDFQSSSSSWTSEKTFHQMREDLLHDSFIIPHDILSSTIQWKEEETVKDLFEVSNHAQTLYKEPYKHFNCFLPYFNNQKYRILQLPKQAIYWGSSHQKVSWGNIQHLSSLSSLQTTRTMTIGSTFFSSMSTWKSQAILKSAFPRQESIFPLLDNYLLKTIARTSGIEGVLSEWMIFVKPNGDFPIYKIRYQVSKNRYCFNVGRMHKSNGVYYEVNLMTRELTQRCWDPDCRGFTSNAIIISDTILPTAAAVEATIKEKVKTLKE